ncbi:chorismate synthase [Plasmodium gonderi]|uniref:chorismate synthase n=1 Tax=Plasmodium gonderi TaxID=77519 RepID=A0A1Y1JHT5_PLAGO|nr:chorismate synthase [Plasmodium gonderi]GAW81800.1 chorismate synthase [Plasmodium gonderi]
MSTYGTLLRVTSFGESHGKAIGCVIDGFLPNVEIDFDLIQKQLNRRRPNQSKLTSNRNEQDKIIILSGFDENKTLGTPIAFLINNEDVKKENYSSFINIPRPGHGDYTYFMKYNVKNKSGSSRFSGRETATRVAAGACIEQWLNSFYNCTIICYVHSVGTIKLPDHVSKNFEQYPPSRDLIDTYGSVRYDERRKIFIDFFNNMYNENGILLGKHLLQQDKSICQTYHTRLSEKDNHISDKSWNKGNETSTNELKCKEKNQDDGYVILQTRCPHPFTAVQICSYILKLKNAGDSIGGIATCVVKNVPIGIGEPIFEKIEAELGKIILSIPAVKGIEFGTGFHGTYMLGSEHNDLFTTLDCKQEEGTTPNGRIQMNTVGNKLREELHEWNYTTDSFFFKINDSHRPGDVSNRSGDASNRSGDVSNRSGDASNRSGDVSNRSGDVSNRSGDASNRSGDVSNPSEEHIDESIRKKVPSKVEKLLVTKTNNCGGILAGITTGNNIVFRSAIKPVSSIQIEKETCDFYGKMCKLKVKGMHDCCILPRIPPIIEASACIVIGDMILRQVAKYSYNKLPSLGCISSSTTEWNR